jgi:serine protease AprX
MPLRSARAATVVLALGFATLASGSVVGAAAAAPGGASVAKLTARHIIVIGQPGATKTIVGDVTAVGGRVTRRLPIINGAAATVSAASVNQLRHLPGVLSVTPDVAGHLMSVDPTLGYDPNADDGSMNLIEQVIGAKTAWKDGYTGKGVDVALIDSGVSPVPGLTSGNVINGPDLSFDSQNPDLTDLDAFGHGTHMASIIAGRDFVGTPAQYAANTSQFLGVAPDARIISVKVAAADGAADVSQVIAAINWVDQNAHTNGLNIRVLNLSYGTNSTQDYSLDPLAYAAEQAWRHGIVVVVSGGNDGQSQYTLADPAYDPYLLAVGAEDPNGTVAATDDTVAPFTTRGTTTRHVDVVAPGVHVLGLRDPGSNIDQSNPGAVVGNRFFRGSGTSQAAAVVSGAAALLIQKYPNATPDQIKRQLMSTAVPFDSASNIYRGNGVVNVGAAESKPLNNSTQNAQAYSTGMGTLDASRGGLDVQDENGTLLAGEQDIFGDGWNPTAWTAAVAQQRSWGADGSWNGAIWTGTGFTGTSWAGQSWGNVAWSTNAWDGTAWDGHHWTSHHWSDSGWNDLTWTDDSWDSHHWTTANWSSWSWG